MENCVTSVLDNIINKSKSKKIKKPNDYYNSDGLLICGNCNQPKEKNADLSAKGKGIVKFPVSCKCDDLDKQRIEQTDFEMHRDSIISKLKRISLLDTSYLRHHIDDDDNTNTKIKNAVVRYANNFDCISKKNMGILFYGDVGTGKTFYASCLANLLLDKKYIVSFANIATLSYSMLKNEEQILNYASIVDMMVIDDIGAERDTSYSIEKLYEIIDTRYRSKKPLIVTTNLSPEELKNPSDMRYKRMFDRILEICYPIKLDGNSKRKIIAKQNREWFKSLIFE